MYSYFIDNICGADLADMQLSGKLKTKIVFLCVFLIVFLFCLFLKYEKGIAITQAFQKILDETERKPNKI